MNLYGRIRKFLGGPRLGLIAGIGVVGVLMASLSPYFLLPRNLLNIGVAVSFIGIVAAISTAVLISGGLDLSIAAVMAFAGTIVAVTLQAGMPWYLGVLLALVGGAAAGAFNGYLISYVGINPFVITVGTQFLVRGLAYLVTGGVVVKVSNPSVTFFGQGYLGPIPVSIIVMIAIFFFVGWILNVTVWGRHWYAIGGTVDGSMARLAGVPVKKRRLQVYLLSGLISALAGVLVAGYTTVGDANALFGLELQILAGVILGGTALTGGRGTVFGTVLGVILVGVINNGIQLLNLGISAQYIFLGAILLLAVVIDHLKNRKAGQ